MISPRLLRYTSLLCLTGLALLATPSFAEEEEAVKVRVTIFLLEHHGVDDAILVPGMRQLDDALRRNPRLEMKDLDTRLSDFAQETPSEQIEEGRHALAEGEKALAARDLAAAEKSLRAAVDALSKVLPFIKKQELAESMTALAVTLCEAGDKKGCRVQFQRLLTWRSDHRYDIVKFSDRHLGLFEEVRKELDRAKRGMIEIRTDPPSAQAFVDGKYVGVTPAAAEGLLAGEHFVTLKKEGYRKTVQTISVSGKVQGKVDLKLERSGKFLLVEEALRAVERSVGQDSLSADIDNLKEVLFLDHAVFVRVKRSAPARVRVESHLYDLRSRRRLATETREVRDADAEKVLEQQASALYLNVKYDAELEAPKDEPVPLARASRRPVYKRWWFWTVIGAAAVGVGVSAGVLVTKYKPTSCGSGNNCYELTF